MNIPGDGTLMPESKEKNTVRSDFEIRDCSLSSLATGKKAQNLKELRYNLMSSLPGSIYYHFWGGLLKPRFDDPEYNNDFASWTRHALHDGALAERLGVIDPTEFPDIEDLREEIIEVIEDRMDESEYIPWCKPDQQFHFITSQIIIFDTHKSISKPEELVTAVPAMSSGSIFYHFIDARRRTFGNMDDFRAWLYGFEGEYTDLCDLLSLIDPFFSTLPALREQLTELFTDYFKGK